MRRRIVKQPFRTRADVDKEVKRLSDLLGNHAAKASRSPTGLFLARTCACDLCRAAMRRLERLRGQK